MTIPKKKKKKRKKETMAVNALDTSCGCAKDQQVYYYCTSAAAASDHNDDKNIMANKVSDPEAAISAAISASEDVKNCESRNVSLR
jgi:hypothetical protein